MKPYVNIRVSILVLNFYGKAIIHVLNNKFTNFEFQELETLLENAKTPISISWHFDY